MVRWPKNKDDLSRMLMLAFKDGCNWGYGIELGADVSAQEEIGARLHIGLLSEEQAFEAKARIIDQYDAILFNPDGLCSYGERRTDD